jgi:plastocyanin
MRRGVVIGVVFGALVAPAGAAGVQPAAQVDAAGNPFTGGLAFDPPRVTVAVGRVVRWTNTDDTVPHTATENHGLWDLAGDYGIPGNTGFGPGESRDRVFEAGTQRYYCKIHPQDMKGVVSVPVRVEVKKLAKGRRIVMTWAAGAPAAGLAFDVQIKRGAGAWKAFRTATRDPSGRKQRHGKKRNWSVRARLRRASDASAATDWSPPASVKA